MPQFPKVNSTYGAPMGRREYGTPETPARLFKVNLDSGAYDDGGAYWGHDIPLYCLSTEPVWQEELKCGTEGSQHFYRARHRLEAIKRAMEVFPDLVLKSMPKHYAKYLEGKEREENGQ